MREFLETLREDIAANRGSPKGMFVVVFYRMARAARLLPWPFWAAGAPVLALYVFVVEWLLGIELGYKVQAGPGLAVHHGQGLVVNNAVVLGRGCVLRHGVTLGNRHPGGPCPVAGDGVEFGAHAVVLGGVRLGDRCRIGAGAVVLEDVPPGCVAVGNPARIIHPSRETEASDTTRLSSAS